MIRRTRLTLPLLCLALLTGCAAPPAERKSDDARENLPAPVIDTAIYSGGGGAARDTVQVYGAYFTTDSTDNDIVLTSDNLRNWSPAKKIVDVTGKALTAVIAHPAKYGYVYIRVYGMNGHYSEPVTIQKY